MARKTRAPATADRKASDRKASDLERIAVAALSEIVTLGWRETSLDGVAARAGLSSDHVRRHAPTKTYLAHLIVDLIDHEALSGARPDAASSPRDRLFDVLMRRFDALQRRRDGIKALVRGLSRSPGAALALALRIDRSAAASLAVAGISPEGAIGCARRLGLKAVMATTLRAWLADDSADMAKTMVALDKALNAAERAATFLHARGRKAPKPGS